VFSFFPYLELLILTAIRDGVSIPFQL